MPCSDGCITREDGNSKRRIPPKTLNGGINSDEGEEEEKEEEEDEEEDGNRNELSSPHSSTTN